MNKERKDWWAPVWTGLVMDPGCVHYTRMKSAVWLYLYLVVNADKNGTLERNINAISRDTGIKERTIKHWLDILRKGGYIQTRNTGRSLCFVVNLWIKKEERHDGICQEFRDMPPSEPASCMQEGASQPQKSLYPCGENRISNSFPDSAIDISINKYIDIDTATKNGISSNNRLAWKLAEALNDRKGIALYRSYAGKYPEAILWEALRKAQEIPAYKIKKSRAALFNHLVQTMMK
ncbi:MAG: hypothetical protein ACYDFU_10740 [Nitrospirota bacterium]